MNEEYMEQISHLDNKVHECETENNTQEQEILSLHREKTSLNMLIDSLREEAARIEQNSADMTLVETESYENMVSNLKLVSKSF